MVGCERVRLQGEGGCSVEVPASQNDWGQPAYNSGDRAHTKAIARNTTTAFEGFDYVVAPSGSCAAMLKHHYPKLFAGDADWELRAKDLAARTHELLSFLADIAGVTDVDVTWDGTVTYHDSCSGLRELKVKDQPRRLLGAVEGLTLTELPTA